MRAVNLSVSVQNFQVFANRNLGSVKMAGEFGHQDTSVTGEQIEYGAASFFVEHGS